MLNNYIADNEVTWFTAAIYDENDNFLGDTKNHIIDATREWGSWTICKKINTHDFRPNTQTYEVGRSGYGDDCGLCVRSYHARTRKIEAQNLREEKRMLAEINYCRVCDFILPVGSGDCWKCANPQHAYRYDDPVHVAYLGYTDPFEAGKAVAGSLLESDDFQLGEIEATAEVMDALEELGVIKQADRDICGDNFAEEWFTNFWIRLPDWESV